MSSEEDDCIGFATGYHTSYMPDSNKNDLIPGEEDDRDSSTPDHSYDTPDDERNIHELKF